MKVPRPTCRQIRPSLSNSARALRNSPRVTPNSQLALRWQPFVVTEAPLGDVLLDLLGQGHGDHGAMLDQLSHWLNAKTIRRQKTC